MIKIINKIDRNNLNSLLENGGQSKMNNKMIMFAESIPEIKKVEDLKELDKLFYEHFQIDKTTKKFESTGAQIFDRKTYSGCSDIGLAIAPILRYKKVPTVYLESANVGWIKDMQENNDSKDLMRGHIFLEIYLDNKWYLYDPTFHLIYDNYDYNNYCLPRNYYVFGKALNSFALDVHSVSNEKEMATKILKEFDINSYVDPKYREYNLRKKEDNDLL